MMQDALYMDDSYIKEFDAKVTSIKDGKFIVLDKTAFYPQGGGQPCDNGKFVRKSDEKEFKVIFVGKFEGKISHQVEPENELKQGDEIKGIIDWERRHKLMRMHTAAHILSAVFHKEAGALITGNQLDLEKSRIDFDLENFDREKISVYTQTANDLIRKELPVIVSYMDRSDAEKEPSLFKLAKELPASIKNLRVVAIGDYDKQADGGTHVKNVKEVGTIEIVKAENKGKSNRRIYFVLK
jgi:misacylated tRNA(Ala) deacylase